MAYYVLVALGFTIGTWLILLWLRHPEAVWLFCEVMRLC